MADSPVRSHPFVRSARLGDEMAIGKIHVASWQHFYRGYMPQDFLDSLDVNRRVDFWRQELLAASNAADQEEKSLKSNVVVVVDESSPPQETKGKGAEKIHGFAMFGPSRDTDPEDRRHIGEVRAIYLQPGSTGIGLGRLLMKAVVVELTRLGYEEVTLWVLDANVRARRFYEQAGWVADGSVKVDSVRGVFTIHEVRYRRSLVAASNEV